MPNFTIEKIKTILDKHLNEFLAYKGVVGVGIGHKIKAGIDTQELAIIVTVIKKKSIRELNAMELIPKKIDGIPTDVQEIGKIHKL